MGFAPFLQSVTHIVQLEKFKNLSNIYLGLMTKRFILVAGNIGVGKTSLTERLGARLGRVTGFESGADTR